MWKECGEDCHERAGPYAGGRFDPGDSARFAAPEALPPGCLFVIAADLDHFGDPARRRIEQWFAPELLGRVIEPAPAMHHGMAPPAALSLNVYRLKHKPPEPATGRDRP